MFAAKPDNEFAAYGDNSGEHRESNNIGAQQQRQRTRCDHGTQRIKGDASDVTGTGKLHELCGNENRERVLPVDTEIKNTDSVTEQQAQHDNLVPARVAQRRKYPGDWSHARCKRGAMPRRVKRARGRRVSELCCCPEKRRRSTAYRLATSAPTTPP